MAHFYNLQGRMDELAQEYFSRTQAANDVSHQEARAAIELQSFYRGACVRKAFRQILVAVQKIARVMRGCLVRKYQRKLRLERGKELRMLFFHHCAAVIQKFFRGRRSRRHLHHFHGRRQYLARVEKAGEYTKQWLQQLHRQNLEIGKQEEEQHMRNEFDQLAGELHHLVSTKAIAGVYNPPYNDVLPRAFGKPIEQHLRDSCRTQLPKALRRPRHRLAGPHEGGAQLGASHREAHAAGWPTGPPQDLPNRSPHGSRSASVGRMQKIQGPFRSREQTEVANAKAVQLHRTIQATSPYELLEDDRKMQQRISKLTRVSPVDFTAPGQPTEGPRPSSVHTGLPHQEKPFELRSDYVELPKIRDKPPFFTALPHDKHFAEYHEQPLLPMGHV